MEVMRECKMIDAKTFVVGKGVYLIIDASSQ
jgi:hypothetical protein